MAGFGSNEFGDKLTGESLRASRHKAVHKFLFAEYKNTELLKGLHKMAIGERYLLKSEVMRELQQNGILDAQGEMLDEVRDIILESVVVQQDGSVVLEIAI